MSEIITLSSDDEDIPEQASKKFKPSPAQIVVSNKINGGVNQVILLTLKNNNNIKEVDKDDEITIIDGDNDIENPSKNGSNVHQNKKNCNEWQILNTTTVKEDIVSQQPSANQSLVSDEIVFSLNTTDATKDNDEDLNTPSTSISDCEHCFQTFLNTCSNSLKNSSYESRIKEKFDKIETFFKSFSNIHNEYGLLKLIEENTTKASKSAPDAVVAFQQIYSHLRETCNNEVYEVEEDNVGKIKRMEKVIRILIKKLKKLDEAEVDWEDDENSMYIQHDRYSKRLDQVYKKYCVLLKKNPYSGRLTHDKMKYTSLKYEQLNKAVNKLYLNDVFPCYVDVESCIRKCLDKFSLKMSEGEIKSEAKKCFTTMGNSLQLRRKRELYETHSTFISLKEDPALDDPQLSMKLERSSKEGEEKLKRVVEKYVIRQEAKVEPELSLDTDDSNHNSDD